MVVVNPLDIDGRSRHQRHALWQGSARYRFRLPQGERNLLFRTARLLHPTNLPLSRQFCRILSLFVWTIFRGGRQSAHSTFYVIEKNGRGERI